jgi:hypothetical protein
LEGGRDGLAEGSEHFASVIRLSDWVEQRTTTKFHCTAAKRSNEMRMKPIYQTSAVAITMKKMMNAARTALTGNKARFSSGASEVKQKRECK